MSIAILLLILFVYIVRPGDWIPGLDIRWNLILNVIGSAAFLFLMVEGKARESWDRTWVYLLAFFFFMMLSSIVMGQATTIPLYVPQMLTNILVFVLVCCAAQNRRHLDVITGVFCALAVFVVYQCHIQMTEGANIAGYGPLLRRSEARDAEGFIVRGETFQALWLGVFEDPNDTGLLLITLLPLIAAKALFLNKGIVARIIPGATSASLVYGVYLTNSRGTFVALLGAVSYFFILRYRSVKGLITAALGGFVLITLGPSRLSSVTAADDAAMERIYAWIEALWAFYLYPFFGLGPKHWQDWHHKTTHNSFVLAFVENGFVAYVCWLAVIVIPLYVVSRGAFAADDSTKRTEYAAYAACLAGVMLSIFFISRTYVLLPYFITACVLTHCRLADRECYLDSLNDATPIRLAAVAAASIVLIWITNILTTRLML